MKKCFVVLMLLLLLSPLALRFAYPESRPLQAEPGEPGFLDSLLGKQPHLIRAWGRINSLWGDSGSPQVVPGREGFLFFRPALDSVLGQGLMDSQDLEELAQALVALHQQLQAQGTSFALLVAPDKGQVLPQYLPGHIRPVDPAGSNHSRLLARLAQLGVPAPDVLPLLQQQQPPAYLPRDTHWSSRGGYLALEAGLHALGIPGLPAFTPQDFTQVVPAPGDLPPLFLPGWPDDQADFLPTMPQAWRAQRPIRSLDDLSITTLGPEGGPRLLVARDSFGRALFPWLTNLASRLVFTRSYSHLAEQARGLDAVLLVIAQRDLPHLLDRLGR